MLRFLIVEQDLRVSGSSQGIISRSFLAKLRRTYSDAVINVVYLKHEQSDDALDLLPVDNIAEHVLNLKLPFLTKFINRFYWRIFNVSLNERFIQKVYRSYISKIDHSNYDHIFIRSSGLNCETILGAKDLPILKKAIITFNEPYPTFWCTGSTTPLDSLELFRHKNMFAVISQAKGCMATAYLARDLQYLYGTRKKFYALPHQFCETVFDFSDCSQVLKKSKKVTISYHGAIQFGRDIDTLLDAYQELVEEYVNYKDNTEFILRLRGQDNVRLREKYARTSNIRVLDTLNFSNSSNEQIHETDITIILENGPLYCNILVGKAPFLAAYNKPVLCVSPTDSELRCIVKDERFIADIGNKLQVKEKLEALIINRLQIDEPVQPFGDYFEDRNFALMLGNILSNN